jgi:hypothetical protein
MKNCSQCFDLVGGAIRACVSFLGTAMNACRYRSKAKGLQGNYYLHTGRFGAEPVGTVPKLSITLLEISTVWWLASGRLQLHASDPFGSLASLTGKTMKGKYV